MSVRLLLSFEAAATALLICSMVVLEEVLPCVGLCHADFDSIYP